MVLVAVYPRALRILTGLRNVTGPNCKLEVNLSNALAARPLLSMCNGGSVITLL